MNDAFQEDEALTTVTGRVVRDRDDRVWVEVPRRSACQSCAKGAGCSMSVLGGLAGGQTTRLEMTGLDAADGSSVELACPSSGVLKVAALAYGLPLLGVLAGALAALGMGLGSGSQALGALLGLGIGMFWARRASMRGRFAQMTLIEQ